MMGLRMSFLQKKEKPLSGLLRFVLGFGVPSVYGFLECIEKRSFYGASNFITRDAPHFGHADKRFYQSALCVCRMPAERAR